MFYVNVFFIGIELFCIDMRRWIMLKKNIIKLNICINKLLIKFYEIMQYLVVFNVDLYVVYIVGLCLYEYNFIILLFEKYFLLKCYVYLFIFNIMII